MYIHILLIAALPVVELRGAIPLALANGMAPWAAFALSVAGNMLPVPFILLLVRPLFKRLQRVRLLRGMIKKLEARAFKKSAALSAYSFWGLVIFVGTPLPGTGAWTGALIAALLDMDFKRAVCAVSLGVLIAGVLVTTIFTGAFAGVEWLRGVFLLK